MDAELPRRLRAARAYSGKTRDEVAADVGISGRQLAKYELGRTEVPRLKRRGIIELVAESTGVDETFFDESETRVAA